MKGIGMRFLASIVLCAFTAVVQASDSFSLGKSKPEPLNIYTAVEGHECVKDGFTTGDIGMSEDGLILSCQSGMWKGKLKAVVKLSANYTRSKQGTSSASLGKYAMCYNNHIHHGSASGHCQFSVDDEGSWSVQVKHSSSSGTLYCQPVCIDFE